MVERVVVESEGLTVSQLCWRRFRKPTSGIVEAVLAYNDNQGLAALGPHLPVGTVVYFPDGVGDLVENEDAERIITLWD